MPRETNPNLKPVSSKKELSGGTKRKLKEEEEDKTKRLAEAAAKFFRPVQAQEVCADAPDQVQNPADGSQPNIGADEPEQQQVSTPAYASQLTSNVPVTASEDSPLSSSSLLAQRATDSEGSSATETAKPDSSFVASATTCSSTAAPERDDQGFSARDPSTWRRPLSHADRESILTLEEPMAYLAEYPRKGNGNHRFNPVNLEKIVKTGERIRRDWIMYSIKSNSLFCLPCMLFPLSSQSSKLSSWSNYGKDSVGFDDYGHQRRGIEDHEKSDHHFDSTKLWKLFKTRSSSGRLIDQKNQQELQKATTFGRQVLRGILDAVLFLAKNNLAFRGTAERIGEKNCGNFLSLVELLGRYYPPLSVHLASIDKGSVSYLSHQTQDEFLSLLSGRVQNAIVGNIKSRKFFSIMFDSTPDSAHKEQISQVIRTVSYSTSGCSIEENFLGFINDEGKTGEAITNTVLKSLEGFGLKIKDCRGQGYDNGSNMSGIYKGVQARVREINPLANFVPCAAHSLNLVGVNAISKNLPAKLLLGQVQNLFSFFSKSTSRWAVLFKSIKITLKGQSSTRWSAKALAVTAVVDQFTGIYEALCELMVDECVNAETVAEAEVQITQIYNFRFLLGATIWERILSRIDRVNLALQKSDISLNDANKHLCGLLDWLFDFKATGFESCLKECKLKAEVFDLDITSGFDKRVTRGRLPARYRNDENFSSSEATNQDPIEIFRSTFFLKLLDSLLEEFGKRFTSIKTLDEDFSFLWGKKLNSSSEDTLVAHAKDLGSKYEEDLCVTAFVSEIRHLKTAITPFLEAKNFDDTKPIDILEILSINNLQESFYNCHTALRVFLTMPVTVAPNERSFSKLKIIKNYLRSSMGQERLNSLATISIERAVVESISFDKVIDDFASKKARKMLF